MKFLTVKLQTFSLRVLETLRADEGLDERPAVGIGITLRGEAGEDGRPGDEGRGEDGRPGDDRRGEDGRPGDDGRKVSGRDISDGRVTKKKSTFYE